MSETITVDGVEYGENTIRLLQQQANECRERGFIDEAGNVRKVLGTLPLTADGCVIGEGARVIVREPSGAVWEYDCFEPIQDEDNPVYSTRAAALAAAPNAIKGQK